MTYACPSCGEHKKPSIHNGVGFSGVITYFSENRMWLFCYNCSRDYVVRHHPTNWQSVVN